MNFEEIKDKYLRSGEKIDAISTKNKIIFQKNYLIITDSECKPIALYFKSEKEIESLIGLLFQLKSELY